MFDASCPFRQASPRARRLLTCRSSLAGVGATLTTSYSSIPLRRGTLSPCDIRPSRLPPHTAQGACQNIVPAWSASIAPQRVVISLPMLPADGSTSSSISSRLDFALNLQLRPSRLAQRAHTINTGRRWASAMPYAAGAPSMCGQDGTVLLCMCAFVSALRRTA